MQQLHNSYACVCGFNVWPIPVVLQVASGTDERGDARGRGSVGSTRSIPQQQPHWAAVQEVHPRIYLPQHRWELVVTATRGSKALCINLLLLTGKLDCDEVAPSRWSWVCCSCRSGLKGNFIQTGRFLKGVESYCEARGGVSKGDPWWSFPTPLTIQSAPQFFCLLYYWAHDTHTVKLHLLFGVSPTGFSSNLKQWFRSFELGFFGEVMN